ncbi:unnamed protein product [Wickerhamomyces anomalus]
MSQEIISEIQEYTILYTYNIVQKLKKWNDGKLKYFKFNNKVQVFNEDSILITQEFLQNDRQLQESNWGNEFKVGGVLITIDCMDSESKRDLTKMFKKDTVTPKTNIIYSKSQIPSAGGTRTPLKELNVERQNSPSLLGMKRRRVGLSKSMTPSRRRQSGTPAPAKSQDELSSSNEKPPKHDTHRTAIPRIKASKTKPFMQVPEPDQLNLLSPKDRSHNVKTPVVKKVISKSISRPIKPNSNTSRSPKLKEKSLDLEISDLNSPSLISSDEFLLLRPPPNATPIKNDQIRWDDDSITKSNAKIKDSLKSIITPRSTPRRITNNRNKREIIQISKPKIPLSELSNKTTPMSKHSKVDVYASDESEYDEIKSQSQSQDGVTMDKITQTETYNYGRNKKGYKVSDIDKL